MIEDVYHQIAFLDFNNREDGAKLINDIAIYGYYGLYKIHIPPLDYISETTMSYGHLRLIKTHNSYTDCSKKLSMAVRGGYLNILQYILSIYDDVDKLDLFYSAITHHRYDIIKYLLSYYEYTNKEIEILAYGPDRKHIIQNIHSIFYLNMPNQDKMKG
jgi:hypothetical protein